MRNEVAGAGKGLSVDENCRCVELPYCGARKAIVLGNVVE
jgi:hypothetical protein